MLCEEHLGRGNLLGWCHPRIPSFLRRQTPQPQSKQTNSEICHPCVGMNFCPSDLIAHRQHAVSMQSGVGGSPLLSLTFLYPPTPSPGVASPGYHGHRQKLQSAPQPHCLWFDLTWQFHQESARSGACADNRRLGGRSPRRGHKARVWACLCTWGP